MNLTKSLDYKIWEYAKSYNFTIVTIDSNFNELLNLYNFPPKIIWIKFGNTTTENIANKIIENYKLITEFLFDIEIGLLILK